MPIFWRAFFLVALIFAPAAIAQDKPPTPAPVPDQIQFLNPPVEVPAVGTPITLTPDLIDIVSFSTPLIVVASPDGIVSVTPDQGPIRIRGRFVDDPTKVHTRLFSAKFLYVVEPKLTGRTELVVWPVGTPDAKSVQRRLIDSQLAPLPPPPPPLPPGPNPVPSDKLRVLIIYGTADKLTAAQNAVLRSTIAKTAIADAGGDSMVLSAAADPSAYTKDPWWTAAWKRKPAITSPPKIILSSPKGFFEGEIPASVDDFVALVKKFAP